MKTVWIYIFFIFNGRDPTHCDEISILYGSSQRVLHFTYYYWIVEMQCTNQILSVSFNLLIRDGKWRFFLIYEKIFHLNMY